MRKYSSSRDVDYVHGRRGAVPGVAALPARRPRSRWAVHALALVALLALCGQVGPIGQGADSRASARAGDASDAPSPSFGLPLAGFRGQQAVPTAVPTVAPSPAPALPAWLQSDRATTLWTTADPGAVAMGEVPQWSYLRSLGPGIGERLPVEEPGDGFARLPSRGWVDASAVGPSGPPDVEWQVAIQPEVPGAPRWQGQAWPQGVTAEFAAIVDGDSGQLLYGKNAHGRVAPASLTKIVTAIVALERGQVSDTVEVSVDGSDMGDSTVMGLRPGQRLSLQVLLYGLMLPSGNDAALAIAQHIGGTETGFAGMMNDLVTRLELKDSHYVNPHGLDAASHFSSPYDMATLARYGMRYRAFAALAGARTYEGEGYQLWNLNRLLWSYDGADGVKIGYTDLAGRAIVGSATRNGHRVFVALMRSPDLWGDTMSLLDYAFKNFRWGS